MYCSNCGKENDDGVAFCSQCGKSPKVAVKGSNTELAITLTIGLVQGCFRLVFVIMFWLTVIGGMVSGAKAAQGIYTIKNTEYSFLSKSSYSGNETDETSTMIIGGLIGLVGGFLVAVWIGGVVATLLKMDKNLQYLADKEKAKA